MIRAWWAAGFLAVGTLLAWMGRIHPVLEIVSNARAQILLVAVLALAVLLLTRSWKPAGLTALLVVINGVYLVPYWFADSGTQEAGTVEDGTAEIGTAEIGTAEIGIVEDSATIRAMQYNLYYGNDDVEAMAEHIKAGDADVVALHELVPETWTQLSTLLQSEYPHTHAVPFDEHEGQLSGGMALLSRRPIDPILLDSQYSPPERVLLAASTTVDGRSVTIVGLHPHASRFESRKVSLRETQVAGVVDLVERTEGPILVLADLNITPTSPVYQDFLADTGWQDPHRSVGWHSTWPTWGGPFGFPIDHVFASNEFQVLSYRTGDGAGSDHRSLVAELSFL